MLRQNFKGDFHVVNRWILNICCLLPVAGWSESCPEKNDLAAIEQKIQMLKESLQKAACTEMDEEVKGQGS